ncbi:MAG: MarR family EPS-associated transcriptional regulator [Candidatus Omnitrophota bacterium]|jgi:EPS-associated MarR family transcriptional regulator|nr:MAG: MarR family EPS-associated transcriptional regulator [Candidatus Omnitrophota bacterium]
MDNNGNNIVKLEHSLGVLTEIEANPQITQRYLSQKLKISLGKVNFLINAFVEKGFIEIKNFKNSKNKIGYMYMLTPDGIKTKVRLTQEFFVWKMEQYEKLKREIEAFNGNAGHGKGKD